MRGSNHPLILVVDDDDNFRWTLCDNLQYAGYRIVEARNGLDALRLLATGERPCLIVLDLAMPVMDGWEFMKRLRADENLPRLPVCVVSGTADKAPPESWAVLAKPFLPDTIVRIADSCC